MSRSSSRRSWLFIAAGASLASGCGSFESRIETPAAEPGARGEVRVHVQSERGVSLATHAPRGVLCSAPCTVEVDPAAGPFVAEVDGRPDSPTFDLPRAPAELNVTVRPAATVLPGLAAVIGTVGLAGMGIGLATLAADLAGVRSFEGTALAGGLTALGGSTVLSVGLTMWFLSGTHVIVEAR